jgi:hypothetical protein
MLNDERNSAAVTWSPGGASLIVVELDSLSTAVLPQYFHHSNYCSFVRQLNMYGFTKVSAEEGGHCREYCHPDFHRDHPEWTQVRACTARRGTTLKSHAAPCRSIAAIIPAMIVVPMLSQRIRRRYATTSPAAAATTPSSRRPVDDDPSEQQVWHTIRDLRSQVAGLREEQEALATAIASATAATRCAQRRLRDDAAVAAASAAVDDGSAPVPTSPLTDDAALPWDACHWQWHASAPTTAVAGASRRVTVNRKRGRDSDTADANRDLDESPDAGGPGHTGSDTTVLDTVTAGTVALNDDDWRCCLSGFTTPEPAMDRPSSDECQ